MRDERFRTRRAQVHAALFPGLLTGAFAYLVVIGDHGVWPFLVASLAATVWASRVVLVLRPDHVYVRNAIRWYRVPYREVHDARRTWHVLLGDTVGGRVSWYGMWALELHLEYDVVEVAATQWLPERDLARLRRLIRGRAARARRADPDEVLDDSPPFEDVRRVLRKAVGRYPLLDSDADDLADVLRERPLTPDDLADVLDDHHDGLLERLNAVAGHGV